MTDYISREAVLTALFNGEHNLYSWDEIEDRLSAIPAADVRPVVLCRDCKWYEINELKKDGTEDRRYKPSVCMLAEQRREPNHFCAGGEKREES